MPSKRLIGWSERILYLLLSYREERACRSARVPASSHDSSFPFKGIVPTPSLSIKLSISCRLPRYQMLLSALTNNTEPTHPDYEALSRALSLMKDVACRIDNNLKRIENKNRIYEIQTRLIGCPVSHLLNTSETQCLPSQFLAKLSRTFLREGVVLKVTSRWVVTCTLFLFSDILVYSHRSLKSFSQLTYKGMVSGIFY